jgi:hypothetical protein
MFESQPLDSLPIWSSYFLAVIFLFLAAEVGFKLGRVIQKRWPDQAEAGVGTVVGAALALLGFLLAFITGVALDNFNQRRHLVVLESDVIGTTYLRAGYLPSPYGVESRKLMKEYVDIRLEAIKPGKLAGALLRSEQIHDELWRLAENVVKENPSPTTALYISSLNEMIDLHSQRVQAELGYRVPQALMLGLFLVAILTMILIGVHDGYREKQNILALIMVVLIISVVFLVIIELDRSNVGLIQVPQRALIELQQQLKVAP